MWGRMSGTSDMERRLVEIVAMVEDSDGNEKEVADSFNMRTVSLTLLYRDDGTYRFFRPVAAHRPSFILAVLVLSPPPRTTTGLDQIMFGGGESS